MIDIRQSQRPVLKTQLKVNVFGFKNILNIDHSVIGPKTFANIIVFDANVNLIWENLLEFILHAYDFA